MLKIDYRLSATGQKTALLAGEPANLIQVIETDDLEVVKRCLDLGAVIQTDGSVTLANKFVFDVTLDKRPLDAKEWLTHVEKRAEELDAQRQRDEAEHDERKTAKRNEEIAKIEAILSEQFTFDGNEIKGANNASTLDYILRNTDGLPEEIDKKAREFIGDFDSYRALYQKQVENSVEAYEAGGDPPVPIIDRLIQGYEIERRIAAERAKRRQQRLAQLIRGAIGDARLSIGKGPLGAISEDEALETVTDLYFPSKIKETATIETYRFLQASDVRKHCAPVGPYDCACESPISFMVDDETDDDFFLTALEYDSAVMIKQMVHNSFNRRNKSLDLDNVIIRVHKGQCCADDCPRWPVRRVGVKFSLDLGDGLTISREYCESPQD